MRYIGRWLRTGAAGVVLGVALAGCGQASPEHGGAAEPDLGIGHVHGLGVDPADGALYVAGHYGLFKVTSPTTMARVADRNQDHMGFTIVGPKTFLASGHPSAEDVSPERPPHLGLIRSADAGVTWKTVSADGSADFHSIQPAGDNLYAFDSQTSKIWRSLDGGATWTQGSEGQAIDLGAGAEQPSRVYATTPDGLKVSEDGGVSFTGVTKAPLLSHVDVLPGEMLVGAGADGQIHTSPDAGKTWTAAGKLPGQASAFTAVDRQRLLAALEDGTVLESKDGGKTFATAFRAAG
ncbi:F510_1955 family glycosylhydrolase [Nonomuraea basaltis]|uniref:F510_1955 family glycosylhydrolase n=1 Tax=Nonomuraea basaltis TaxID=2495887 RepID=UPI00110C4FA4|nr:sialidase family protein [Nonomuraea basaltis]TMR93570.1 exo-alpha-sialidase [Nonomuraea basaltis]